SRAGESAVSRRPVGRYRRSQTRSARGEGIVAAEMRSHGWGRHVAEQRRMRENGGLSQMLRDHLTEWSERTGIAVEVWALPEREVPPKVADNVYATVREALDNVERHSGARVVSIALTVGRSGLRLTVSDEGRGFEAGTTGRGLVAMRAYFAE